MISKTPAEFENWQGEEYRKSMDSILVYNPTDKDYFVMWDRMNHLVPNKSKDIGFGAGQVELPRYIADKYLKEMKDLLINEEVNNRVKEKIEDRAKKGMPELTPYEKNVQVTDYLPKTSDEKKIIEIYGNLFKGVVREFGLYDVPESSTNTKPDTRTAEEKAMEALMNNKVESKQPTKAPTIDDKKKRLEEVTQE